MPTNEAAEVARRSGIVVFTFLGTRGEIGISSKRHRRHSALLIEHKRARIMIDCGADWLGRLNAIAPTAIVLTHGHPDHAAGLAQGAPCPVYATSGTLRLLRHFPIAKRRRLPLTRSVLIDGVRLKAYRVQHSVRAPAVGYRISANGRSLFYLPDVAKLPNPARALRRVDVYVGDGATLKRPILRKRNGVLIGHAAIATQLDWCSTGHVHKAIFTHCGSSIVRRDWPAMSAIVRELGRRRGIDASLACDGDRLRL